MQKRVVLLIVFAMVLISILSVANIQNPFFQQVGSGAAMPALRENIEETIFLPLVSNKLWHDITVLKTAGVSSVPETGGDVTFTYDVTNNSTDAGTITALSDDQFGTLAGDEDCQVGTVLAAGASCSFEAIFSIPAGDFPGTHVNIFSVTVDDDDGNSNTETEDETVNYTDVFPDITVLKTAGVSSVPDTGGIVTFTYDVTNNSTEAGTITALSDDQFGTLAGDEDCQVGTVLAAGASCSFEATFSIPAGDFPGTHVNIFSATVEDDDGNSDTETEDETVNYIDVFPEMCYAPGTQHYQPPTVEIPEITLQHGTTITVTTTADTINGDVSSVSQLLSNPGPDGVSLREAITATNNDPGEYTINFSPDLDGSTIYTGANNQDLPPLMGGSVIINGDIDGDTVPDITIANLSTFYPFGFKIESSNNTLYALQMEGYFIAVAIFPVTTGTTYANITISNMVVRDSLVGINLHAGPDGDSIPSYNLWENIVLINNYLDVSQDGITFHLNQTIGDHLDNVTVANNNIHITQDVDRASFGIQFMAGFWVGSDENVMNNITVTHNTIQGNPDKPIAFLSGAVAGSSNVIDGVIVLENEILIHDTNFDIEAGKYGIALITGDGSSAYMDPGYDPITFPKYNAIRNVDIVGNRIEGFDANAITVLGGCCGAANNTIENIKILRNQILSLELPDVYYAPNAINVTAGSGYPYYSEENMVSNIIIQENSIALFSDTFLQQAWVGMGAITFGGGYDGARNQVHDIWISLNEVDSVIPGITLIGGGTDATENVISTGHIFCNTVIRSPIYPIWDPSLTGIVFVGADRDSTLNRVENISLFYNNVAGIWNDLTVIPNVHETAVNNVVDYQIIP